MRALLEDEERLRVEDVGFEVALRAREGEGEGSVCAGGREQGREGGRKWEREGREGESEREEGEREKEGGRERRTTHLLHQRHAHPLDVLDLELALAVASPVGRHGDARGGEECRECERRRARGRDGPAVGRDEEPVRRGERGRELEIRGGPGARGERGGREGREREEGRTHTLLAKLRQHSTSSFSRRRR